MKSSFPDLDLFSKAFKNFFRRKGTVKMEKIILRRFVGTSTATKLTDKEMMPEADGRTLPYETARKIGSQDGYCVYLGESAKNEKWLCRDCNRIISGNRVIHDLCADAFCCPECYAWNIYLAE